MAKLNLVGDQEVSSLVKHSDSASEAVLAGLAIGDAAIGAGKMQVQLGQEMYDKSIKAMDNAALNEKYTGAAQEYNTLVQDRMSKMYDEDGTPNFDRLDSDVQKIGQDVHDKYAGKLIKPELNQSFSQQFNQIRANKEVQAAQESRNQMIQHTGAKFTEALQTTVNMANGDKVTNSPAYYASALKQIKDAQIAGIITPQQAVVAREQARSGIYMGGLKQLNATDPVAVRDMLNSGQSLLGITPEEQAQLASLNATHLKAMEREARVKEKEKQSLIHDQQKIVVAQLDYGIAKGLTTSAAIEEAALKGQIPEVEKFKLLKTLETSITKKGSALDTRNKISATMRAGDNLSRFTPKEISDHYNNVLDGASKPYTYAEKGALAASYHAPVEAFAKDVEMTILAGDSEKAAEAAQAYKAVQIKNPLAVSGVSGQAAAIAADVETSLQSTNISPAQALKEARERVLKVGKEVYNAREAEFSKLETVKLENQRGLIDKIYSTENPGILGKMFGAKGTTIDPEARNHVMSLYKEGYLATGNEQSAMAYVRNRTAGILGVSELGNPNKKTLMFKTPEMMYPNLSGEDLKRELLDDAKTLAPSLGVNPEDIYIKSDRVTSTVKGKASWSMYYTDKNGIEREIENTRFAPDAQKITERKMAEAYEEKTKSVLKYRDSKGRVSNLPVSHNSSIISQAKMSLGGLESGNNYKKLGPEIKGRWDRALGRYQVMESNLPQWSREAIGRVVNKEEFLSNPEIQDQIFEHKFNQYLKQYGTVEDALSMWHSGRPLNKAQNAVDKGTGLRTTHYVQKILNNMSLPGDSKENLPGSLPGHHMVASLPADQDENKHPYPKFELAATDESRMLQPYRSEEIGSELTNNPDTFASIKEPVGTILLANTQQYAGTPYKFGAKDVKQGGIDCSGWVAKNTLDTMDRIARNLGVPFNMNSMKDLLNQGAAWQVSEIGKLAGFFERDQVVAGQVPAGTIIGIRYNNVPKWAKGRPMGISHVVQVVEFKGKKFISESSSSKKGVSLTPITEWVKQNIGQQFFATNPFNLLNSASMLGR